MASRIREKALKKMGIRAKKLKNMTRIRMQVTGESYAKARQAILEWFPDYHPNYQMISDEIP